MRSDLHVLLNSKALLLLALSLFFLSITGYQAILAQRLAIKTVEAYTPKVERQAVALIVKALPDTDNGRNAAHLALGMDMNINNQYIALVQAVQSQSQVLLQQTGCWAVISIFAAFTFRESRRKVASAT